LGTLAIIALGLDLAACGNSSRVASSARANSSGNRSNYAPSNFSTHNNDRDNDGDHNDDDAGVLYFGHAAGPADERAAVALVTRYFAAAAAGDGAAGCRLLAPFIAESLAEEDGHSPRLRGTTCAVVLSKLFKLHHALLAEKHATLKVIGVRLEGARGLVIFDFPAIPEVRQITERRVGHSWRLLYQLDGILE
jgi:hypothetical protein